MIEVRQARYFIAVAEELHFGRAAERLQMSQPPLSQAIQQLERQVGARLLERSSRTVTLTKTGNVLLQHCYSLLATAARAHTATAQAQAGQLGNLTLGAVTSAFADPLRAVLDEFRAARPRVELRVHEVDTHQGVQALLDMKLDIAVIRYSGKEHRLRVHVLRHDHLIAALPTRHKYSTKRSAQLAVLAEDQWVWIPRVLSPDYHDELITACRRSGFSPQVHHHATSIYSQLAMVACGLGVALVPQTAAVPLAGVHYIPLHNPFSLVELAVVHRAGVDEPLTEQFVQCALRTAKDDTHQSAERQHPAKRLMPGQ